MKKTTILIVDDHTLVRETWSLILNTHPNFEVVGEAGHAEIGIELAQRLRPDVVIMDINLPDLNGIEATRQIQKNCHKSKVLGVSLHTQPTYAKKMMKAGAAGYVTKNSSREEMFTAVTEVMKGNKFICQEIKNILSDQMLSGCSKQGGLDDLSNREKEIVLLIQQGMTSKEMAAVLAISVKTVEVHRYNILQKLNVKNSAALVNYINTRLPDHAV